MAAPQHIQQPIEADVDDDADSAIGVRSLASSTTSIGSSILKGRQENGRTYHAYKDGKYVLPEDETEQDRLDLQHHVHLITFDGKLDLIPRGKKQFQRVLDVGTGTGIWAIDYADENPEAEVLGVDLSPMQPTFLPPNLRFEIDDLEERWLYHQKFDFIHVRGMSGSFKDWQKFFDQAFEFTSPGGYIHVHDSIYPLLCDDDTFKGTALEKWSRLTLDATVKIGRPANSAIHFKEQLEKSGWVDLVERTDVWVGGTWPKDPKLKEIGIWTRENLLQGLEGFALALFTRVHGWSVEEVQLFLVDVRKDLKNSNIHWYVPMYTIYGRKPE